MLFNNPEQLPWIFILVFFVLIYIIQIQIRDSRLKKWLGKRQNFLKSLVSEKKRHLKMALRLLSILFFILALARPQIPGEKMDVERSGVYILILADVSQSMLVEDVKPSRLFFMKQELSRFLDMSKNDQVALVAFASSSVLLSPFTLDISAVKSYLSNLTPNYFSSQGTDFGRALNLSGKIFKSIREKKQQSTVKVIIIASDGEDHSPSTKEKIKELLEQKIRIFTLSFGTKEGGVIPVKDNTGEILEYKKDFTNKLVVSKVNNKDLKNFAKLGKGAYYHVTYGSGVMKKLRNEIDKLEKSTFEKSSFVNKKEIYHRFLIIGLFLAMCELVLGERRSRLPKFANKEKST